MRTCFPLRLASLVAVLLLAGYGAHADDVLTTAQIGQEPEPYRHVLQNEIDGLAKKQSTPAHLKSYEPSTITVRVVEPKAEWQKMFPRHRFYAVTYTNRPLQGLPGRFPGRPVTVKDGIYVFIVGPTSKYYKTFDLGAANDDFVRLLRDNRVVIRSEDDVRRVWKTYLALESVLESDRFSTIPGYEQGHERQSRAPIQPFMPLQWDIAIGYTDFSNKPISAPIPGTSYMKVVYRITLNTDKTVASIKRTNQPCVRID